MSAPEELCLSRAIQMFALLLLLLLLLFIPSDVKIPRVKSKVKSKILLLLLLLKHAASKPNGQFEAGNKLK